MKKGIQPVAFPVAEAGVLVAQASVKEMGSRHFASFLLRFYDFDASDNVRQLSPYLALAATGCWLTQAPPPETVVAGPPCDG
ncbi:hypothetical protein ACNKHO_17820 [Shigella flexneri]